jgi:hypothetical protein
MDTGVGPVGVYRRESPKVSRWDAQDAPAKIRCTRLVMGLSLSGGFPPRPGS